MVLDWPKQVTNNEIYSYRSLTSYRILENNPNDVFLIRCIDNVRGHLLIEN
jgi:hypothetical protein